MHVKTMISVKEQRRHELIDNAAIGGISILLLLGSCAMVYLGADKVAAMFLALGGFAFGVFITKDYEASVNDKPCLMWRKIPPTEEEMRHIEEEVKKDGV